MPICFILDYYLFPLALFKLGGLQAIAELLQVDCEMYGLTNDHYSITLRRYAGMALTNLTFGDVANKVCFIRSISYDVSRYDFTFIQNSSHWVSFCHSPY